MQGCKGLSCPERLTAPELVQVSKVARCSIVIKFLKKCLGCNDISNHSFVSKSSVLDYCLFAQVMYLGRCE